MEDQNLTQAVGSTIPAGNVATNQTGGMGTPVQVENVQYNVQVGKVRSKIGLIGFLFAVFSWIITVTVIMFLCSVWSQIIEVGNEEFKFVIVFSLSILVPIVPIFWYVRRRLNRVLEENPSTIDDIFFKKTVRFNLVLTLIFSVGWIIISIYSVLSALFLEADVSLTSIGDNIIFAACFSALTLLFLQYQLRTKR